MAEDDQYSSITVDTANCCDDEPESDDDHERHPSKQRKPPHKRSRVSRACDRCKTRKSRCSGKYPCAHCSRAGLDCTYTAVYRRGRLPSIEIDTGDDNKTSSDTIAKATEEQLRGSSGQPAHMPSPVSVANRKLAPPRDASRGASVTQSSRNSPEPAQTDQQGHYVGPASAASFLLRIQRKLQQHEPSTSSSDTSIFTFGDLPLPEPDPRFLILPPRAEAELLLRRYFEFAAATHRFLHRPTVERWLAELYDTQGAMGDQGPARSKTALLFMIFAQAENYPHTKAGNVDPTSSARFFSAAEDQLSAEKGAIRLTSVQARLAQCFYLMSQSRLNHCWSLFGTTAHLMLALGIHRKSRYDPNGNTDNADMECRKRTFWCAYNLDTYLSAALGRPRTFHDDDIDQELPLCIDDYRLVSGQPAPLPAANPQSVMSGPVAHIKLSRIIANVLRDLYGIRPPSTDNQLALADKYAAEVDTWRRDVAYLIDTDGVDPSIFQPIFLRQRNVLNLACWHTQLLVHRPFLLNNFASLTNLGPSRRSKTPYSIEQTQGHVERCLNAAMNIASLIDNLSTHGQLYSTFWFSHYFAFCAVVVLYVHTMQQRNSPPETYLPAFHAATKCQIQITFVARPGSLAQRYGVVLQELRIELLRHNSHLFALAAEQRAGAIAGPDPIPEDGNPAIGNLGIDDLLLEGDMFGPRSTGPGRGQMGYGDEFDFLGQSPDSSIVQMTGWGQFDSLVTGGAGRLDSFLGGDLENWDLTMGGDAPAP